MNNEDKSELEQARSNSGVSLIESEKGATRYQVFGEENSPTVVLIHSFNGFLESWDSNINALVNAGYRVITYDLFGRGLSDRPHVDYDLSLFRHQLDGVLKAVGATNVHLVGSSFGGVIASDFAYHYPDRAISLVLVGPAGWSAQEGRNPLLDIPLLGDLAFHYFGQKILRPKVEAYLFNQSKFSDVVEQWANYASYPGFTRSALSTLRHSPVLDYSNGWIQLGKLGKPTLFIWGKQDVSFPFANTEKIPTLIPHAKIIGIEDAAHWVNVEQAQQVNEAIVSFLFASDSSS
ncbi:alpha/beta fold hydrolase [Veronia nyctiphanis]|nr:alpha/beta hydrolase [Veronia nyctiphanis]